MILKMLFLGCGLIFLSACSFLKALDFGGADTNFEVRAGWDHRIHQAAAGTAPGATDDKGVYKPETKEADALLAFPNVHSGVLVEGQPKQHVTPVINLELVSMKAPYVGWWEIQVGVGANVADAYLGKRLLSILEITVGPCFLRDVDEHKWGWGGIATIIRF